MVIRWNETFHEPCIDGLGLQKPKQPRGKGLAWGPVAWSILPGEQAFKVTRLSKAECSRPDIVTTRASMDRIIACYMHCDLVQPFCEYIGLSFSLSLSF